ncbi:GNAT family N-acetyltransferase [Paracrocinitomix mangrovi]|uniref:GNAT family N-acetyltransferase n=1 Tax=Paracrocinitomix mangrovi TaxID=2862509 RepID=UPI001C8DDEC1|nr:GNAT family N-acetyltransferase [Paracrocinitomix mangrovi]UKN01253.1 GNAT family N-acetyltransferase [Paracrocinitomix mangrovi]
MKLRKAHNTDRLAIAKIYAEVAGDVQGITRLPEEITQTYIFSLLNKPEDQCVIIVVEDDHQKVIGFGHAEKSSLKAYRHILSNFTIGVSPDAQEQGVGRGIFMGFLDYLTKNRSDIKRLEMEVAYDEDRIKLFEGTGFKTEAIIKGRVKGVDGKLYDQALMAWENPNYKP